MNRFPLEKRQQEMLERRKYFSPECRALHKAYQHCQRRGIPFTFTSLEHFLDAAGPRPSAALVLRRTGDVFGPGSVRWAPRRPKVGRPRKDEQDGKARPATTQAAATSGQPFFIQS